jgi:hypothetical protein
VVQKEFFRGGYFIPGRKTCHECLKKQRNYKRKKRRKEKNDEIL